MIVDVHTHGPTHRDTVPEDERAFMNSWRPSGEPIDVNVSWADFDKGTEAADVSIVFNIASLAEKPGQLPDSLEAVNRETVNSSIEEFVAARPDKRIGFMSVHPLADGYLEEMERAQAAGLKGIKLGANYQNFDPLGDEARALYAFAQKNGLPILFHQGTSPIQMAPIRYSYPLVMDEVAIAYPDLHIVMEHLGHPFTRETVAVVRKHPNVYADVSMLYIRPWTCYEGLTMASEWGIMHKLLLGSDYPGSSTAEAIARLRAVNDIVEGTNLPKVSAEHIEGIIHADALTAMGLDDPRSAGR
jgi:predicted TIM-barrel fold metal-dependent hydrolase